MAGHGCGWACASLAELTLAETSGDGRAAVRPRPRLLELSGEADERRLAEAPADELHADREPCLAPVKRHRHRRLTRDIDERCERREQRLARKGAVRVALGVLPGPADGNRLKRQRGGDDDVDVAPERGDPAGDLL
jgi:hypothetical protein